MAEKWGVRYGEKFPMGWRPCSVSGLGEAEAKRIFDRKKAQPRSEINAGVLIKGGEVVDCFGGE